VPRESSTPYSPASSKHQRLELVFELEPARRQKLGHAQAEVGVLPEQTLEVRPRHLGDHRVLHRLGHLLAGAAGDHASLAEDLGRPAVSERERLAVAGDLGDLDAAAVDDEQRLAGVTRQIDHLASPDLAHVDRVGQLTEHLGTERGQQRYLPQVPEHALLVLHGN
jgi:hypothetical protein